MYSWSAGPRLREGPVEHGPGPYEPGFVFTGKEASRRTRVIYS